MSGTGERDVVWEGDRRLSPSLCRARRSAHPPSAHASSPRRRAPRTLVPTLSASGAFVIATWAATRRERRALKTVPDRRDVTGASAVRGRRSKRTRPSLSGRRSEADLGGGTD
eukprot:scaffold7382_cov406-Prasinococcus_capsulatus_cf.AAC.4